MTITVRAIGDGTRYEALVDGESLGLGNSPDEALGHAVRELGLQGYLPRGLRLEFEDGEEVSS